MGSHVFADHLSLPQALLDSIRRLVRALRLFDRAAEKQAGLSAAALFLLQSLEDGNPVSIKALAIKTRTDPSSVSVVLDRLRQKRLIAQRPNPADLRSVLLSITTRGRAIAAAAPPAAQGQILSAFSRLSIARQTQLVRSLQHLVGQMGLSQSPPGLFFEDQPPHADQLTLKDQPLLKVQASLKVQPPPAKTRAAKKRKPRAKKRLPR